MAFAWVIASRFSTTLRNLSLTLVGAETIPTLDLNLPKGVMLGSWLVVGDYAVDFVANTKKDVADLIETGQTSESTGPLDILIATIIQVTGLANDKRRVYSCLALELFALSRDIYMVDTSSDTSPYREVAKKRR